jgi:S-DNA-T family DNA segregation ATPase FtsK/SpoIIIE
MATTYVLLSIIIFIQIIILFISLKPYIKTGFDRLDDKKLYDEVVQVVQEEDKVSTSYIQRRFGLGYTRSMRIVDMLEERGVIGKANKVGQRQVLIKKD